ncbi:hypothetical protein P842_02005 [Enterobacter roggenkampii UCI 39]|uniref:methyltransferase domain-containing protein n=1 Tax=Enterobacter TaxID=547 RepID=UPI00044559A5|nr:MULTISPECIES: methyltransferase domain-containing protein [Enterobacter]EUL60825.1 hypothetical protein P842_02005 [Enterobacter roggenkampii UCI 39]MCE1988931.1 class I SAM-dependent methyltransferase [Enterobacter roggenkampii]MCK6706249.1 class I SAM-dependent methyltransferase [Enterobacter roggenkampii]MCK6909563.1 class I SAM-dependent methyltransferase [Enterobacter roggenkampii]MCK7203494.1 class I SAM-dependent methyltransferase [Enterobacter roggenkampii]
MTITCLICNSEMKFYFEKPKYHAPSAEKFTQKMMPVQYYQCPECGFFSSKTHQELSLEEWEKFNTDFHHYNENGGRETLGFNQPPYAEQALMIELLARNNIIDDSRILDYAAGYGTLSHLIQKYFKRNTFCYDKYVQNPDFTYIDDPDEKSWSLVVNSAMFEHVITRNDLDNVNRLVDDAGSLFIHTVVVEKVPEDPNWFYIDVPVHTCVHTNKSMSILMEQWGYRSSVYSPKSKSWVFLRQPYKEVKPIIERINQELQTTWLFGKDGFLDYWK